MIQISNSQRDDICRYMQMLFDLLEDKRDNRSYNARRRAGKLLRILRAKTPVPAPKKTGLQDSCCGNM